MSRREGGGLLATSGLLLLSLPGKNFVIVHRLASDLGNTVDDDAAIAVAR